MKNLPVFLVQLFVGLLFTFSGLIKVNDITGFAYKLEEYFHVFENHSGLPFSALNRFAVLLAGAIAVFETMLALFLLLGFARRFTTTALLGMIIFFTFLTAYSAITKSVSDCGCFGDAIKLKPWHSFLKDVFLLALISYLYLYQEHLTGFFSPQLRRIAAAASILLISWLTYHFYAHLPLIDFLPYKVGTNLKAALVTLGPDGFPLAKDYAPVKNRCGIDEFEGTVVFIVIRQMEDLSQADYQKIRQAIARWPANIKVVGLTASPSDVREKLAKEHELPFCWAPQDETLLKSLLRAPAGAVVLQNGIITAKFHLNDFPDGKALAKALHP
ncbi:MAG: MauE/DoxX family redox-associated membrane protein [Bacteroidia bacterium]